MESLPTKKEIDYEKLNEYLNNYCLCMDGSNFIENLSFFYYLTQQLSTFLKIKLSSYDVLNEQNKKRAKQQHLSLMEMLGITEKYIESRMPEYKDDFSEYMKNGIINIVADPLNGNDNDLADHAGINEQNHAYINTVLVHNSYDPPTLIHEFLHILNQNLNGPNSLSRAYITEGISIYFEMDMTNFMLNNGFNSEDVFQDRLYRLEDFYYCVGDMKQIFPILLCFEKIGPINEKSFKEMKELKVYPRPATEDDFSTNLKNSATLLLKKDSLHPLKEFGYVIGTLLAYYAIDQKDERFHQKMLNLNKKVNTDIFPDILEYLGLDIENSKELCEKLSPPLEHEIQRISKNLNKKSANKK